MNSGYFIYKTYRNAVNIAEYMYYFFVSNNEYQLCTKSFCLVFEHAFYII